MIRRLRRSGGGIDGFAARYPQVWHVIEAEGAGCDTLYPTATLRRLSGLPADNANRETFQRLDLPGGAPAILRPQLMPDAPLARTLAGAFAGRPDLWRAHIDRHVFFWVTEDRRDRFLRACVRLRARGAVRPLRAPHVAVAETGQLLAAHGEAVFFSRINTGSTLRGGAKVRRDETTLCPIRLWSGEDAVELAIRGPVPLSNAVVRVRPVPAY